MCCRPLGAPRLTCGVRYDGVKRCFSCAICISTCANGILGVQGGVCDTMGGTHVCGAGARGCSIIAVAAGLRGNQCVLESRREGVIACSARGFYPSLGNVGGIHCPRGGCVSCSSV